MIVEAVRTDSYGGSLAPAYREHSRYKCVHCDTTYEYIIDAVEGEFDALSDSVPVHFEMLSDRIDQGHALGHIHTIIQTDGTRCWSPQQQAAILAWTN